MRYWIALMFIINIITALIIIFREKRDVSSTWGWLVVLIGLPGIGLFFYMFIGKKLSQDNIFDLQKEQTLGLKRIEQQEKSELTEQLENINDTVEKELAHLFLQIDSAVYSKNNHLEMMINGEQLFETILNDIQQAKHHIHLQYYIFNNDNLGNRIMSALYEKAKQGIQVSVLYDALGSRTLRPSFFKKLIAYGGMAVPFFGSPIPFVNLRMNYRNHRKIIVIDGKIGYTGGFNIGDEYIGKSKFGEWRDTHLRLKGDIVHALQTRFLIDWNAAVNNTHKKRYVPEYFPKCAQTVGNCAMQLVSSGPESDIDQIKLGFLKMISSAKQSIYLQTPYFIPDQSLMDALEIALSSGVEVNIMIPCQPDHAVVYRATEYYAKWATKLGANIYIYNEGFLHCKTLVIDEKIATVGTANFDIRSFSLNFEVNVFVYNTDVAKQLVKQFKQDTLVSLDGDLNYFAKQSLWKKIKQELSRLFSPIL